MIRTFFCYVVCMCIFSPAAFAQSPTGRGVDVTFTHFFCKLTVSSDHFKTGESSSLEISSDILDEKQIEKDGFVLRAHHSRCFNKPDSAIQCKPVPGIIMEITSGGYMAETLQTYDEPPMYLRLGRSDKASIAVCVGRK